MQMHYPFNVAGRLQLGIADHQLTIIDGPDPVLLITDELLFGAYLQHRHRVHPDITVERPTEGHGSELHDAGFEDCLVSAGRICFRNAILRIQTVQRLLVYEVWSYDWARNAWWAQWPD